MHGKQELLRHVVQLAKVEHGIRELEPCALVKRASDHRKTAEFPGEISEVNGVYRYGRGS